MLTNGFDGAMITTSAASRARMTAAVVRASSGKTTRRTAGCQRSRTNQIWKGSTSPVSVSMSVGAGAVKQLKAQTRLALTGTPMENHPGELWSIFDFVLPGYLNSFAQFMHRFGTGEEGGKIGHGRR